VHQYTFIRSGRKTVSLEITRDGAVIVRAPMGMTRRQADALVAEREVWIAEHLEKTRRRQAPPPEPTDAERDAFVDRAMKELPEKVKRYAAMMGVRPAGITVTGARTRFGSCSTKNRICFSWRLMRYPEAAIDYVVVHELAHILNKNHAAAFYTCVASVMPDYREREKLLKCAVI
jgi:predicted metal-dependent hydrolase